MSAPDYTAQHRVVALQAAVALSGHRWFIGESLSDVLATSELLLDYLNDGTLPE